MPAVSPRNFCAAADGALLLEELLLGDGLLDAELLGDELLGDELLDDELEQAASAATEHTAATADMMA